MNNSPSTSKQSNSISDTLKNGAGKLFQITQGRHTAFTIGFFIMGNVMHWFHRLDATYIGYMGTLMGFVLGHSIKDDYADKRDRVEP